MADYTLNFFSLSDITTEDPNDFIDNGGYKFDPGVSTVTITPGATAQPLTVTDTDDPFFDDDEGAAQTLNGDYTLNGTPYPSGTNIEAEYVLFVEDSLGNPYVLQFVSVDGDAFQIEGFVIQGAVPPFGEALTVTSTADMVNDTYGYSTSANPVCFEAAARILTEDGPIPAANLRPGIRLCLAGGGTARLELVIHNRILPRRRADNPIELRPGSLAPGLPQRRLLLSPNHRVHVPELNALVPAKSLTGLRGIGRSASQTPVHYLHLVLAQHALILAEGVPCESLWPGPMTMRSLPKHIARRLREVMGPTPRPAAPFLSHRETQLRLRGRSALAGCAGQVEA